MWQVAARLSALSVLALRRLTWQTRSTHDAPKRPPRREHRARSIDGSGCQAGKLASGERRALAAEGRWAAFDSRWQAPTTVPDPLSPVAAPRPIATTITRPDNTRYKSTRHDGCQRGSLEARQKNKERLLCQPQRSDV